MSKSKTLIKNTAIIGVGSLGTKVLTFLLLPLYTAVLSTEDYGTIDVLMTISSLLIPFATMEMSSGIFRFLIDSKDECEKKGLLSSGIVAELLGLSVTVLVIVVINLLHPIPHCSVFVFYFITMSLWQLFANCIRGLGNNTLYSVSSFVVSLVSLVLNVFFILGLKMTGYSILLATSIGNMCGIAIVIIGQRLWILIDPRSVRKDVFQRVSKFTIPLIPNTVSWWVVSASDRLLILCFLSASANGIYAVANKIPGIYATIFSVYSLAWTEAVARDTDDSEFISKTYHNSINIMIYMFLGIIACSSLFFDTLIKTAYSDSYWHIFILLFAIFFSSCSSLLGGIFGAKFESKAIMATTLLGAVANVLINILGISIIGLYAASISTLIAYFIVFIIRMRGSKKWYQLKMFDSSDIVLVPLLVMAIIGYALKIKWFNALVVVSIVFVFCIQHKNTIVCVFNKLINKKQ